MGPCAVLKHVPFVARDEDRDVLIRLHVRQGVSVIGQSFYEIDFDLRQLVQKLRSLGLGLVATLLDFFLGFEELLTNFILAARGLWRGSGGCGARGRRRLRGHRGLNSGARPHSHRNAAFNPSWNASYDATRYAAR